MAPPEQKLTGLNEFLESLPLQGYIEADFYQAVYTETEAQVIQMGILHVFPFPISQN